MAVYGAIHPFATRLGTVGNLSYCCRSSDTKHRLGVRRSCLGGLIGLSLTPMSSALTPAPGSAPNHASGDLCLGALTRVESWRWALQDGSINLAIVLEPDLHAGKSNILTSRTLIRVGLFKHRDPSCSSLTSLTRTSQRPEISSTGSSTPPSVSRGRWQRSTAWIPCQT